MKLQHYSFENKMEKALQKLGKRKIEIGPKPAQLGPSAKQTGPLGLPAPGACAFAQNPLGNTDINPRTTHTIHQSH